ncbi:MAG: cell division protein ZapB [Spirochaetia bacterium]|jgi:chromosome segregation ATPase|nr:cell division protein ZapB [Spirochaetia bacterium]
MITLDQIKQLDSKVRKAIDKINSLKSANNILQEKLDTYQIRIEELEILIQTFKEDQGEIEHGIIDALNQLDIMEENIIIPEENNLSEQDSSKTDNETITPVMEENT